MDLKDKGAEIVFVYGALRSGTTVFRLMLDAHPDVANPGEMDFLFDYLHPNAEHSTGWSYDLEQLKLDRIFNSNELHIPPQKSGLDLLEDFLTQIENRCDQHNVMSINVHRNIDRIIHILPEVRCIHMLRDPRDVARSSIAMGWAYNIYYGVDHWMKTERAWDQGTTEISANKVLDLTYEQLFTNIDTQLHRVCDFLKISWHPSMLNYHENSTYSAPDSSLVEQWRRKCTQAELNLLESKAGELMTSKGYHMSGDGHPPAKSQKLMMAVKQKIFHWRFGTARYGILMFFGEKVTRKLKLKSIHSHLRSSMSQIEQSVIK